MVAIEKGAAAPFKGYLYPTENAVRVTQKAEKCDFMLKAANEHKKQMVMYEQGLCFQRLEHASEAAKLREQILQDKPLPYWAIGLAYLSGVVTVVLAAWVGQEIAR